MLECVCVCVCTLHTWRALARDLQEGFPWGHARCIGLGYHALRDHACAWSEHVCVCVYTCIHVHRNDDECMYVCVHALVNMYAFVCVMAFVFRARTVSILMC